MSNVDIDPQQIFLAQLSGRMRHARQMADKTQAEAAALCSVSHRSYKDYELGNRPPPIDVLMRFCVSFELEPQSFFFGTTSTSRGFRPEDVEEIASGVMSTFEQTSCKTELRKRAGLVRYAWENAQAKGRDFIEELNEASALIS